MLLKTYRTSISLPVEIVEKLTEAATEDYPLERLAVLCLKKLLRRAKIAKISSRPTCEYNEDGDYEIKNIWLTRSQHHNVKMYRIVTGQSVSFLTAQAVGLYLDGLVSVLNRLNTNWKSQYVPVWLDMQFRQLNSINRVLRFSSAGGKGVLGLRIVMQRPELRWAHLVRKLPKYRPMPPDLRERLGL